MFEMLLKKRKLNYNNQDLKTHMMIDGKIYVGV